MKTSEQYHSISFRIPQLKKSIHKSHIKDNRAIAIQQAKLIHMMEQKSGKETRPANVKQTPLSTITSTDFLSRTPIQRLRQDLQTGFPYEYIVDKNALGTGSGTTPAIRNAVNAPNINPPQNLKLQYAIYNSLNAAQNGVPHVYQTIVNVPNPPLPKTNWDAGHALAKQNGGSGDNINHVFPQNRIINRGWAGTFGQWRGHEQTFHDDVQIHGYGRWKLT